MHNINLLPAYISTNHQCGSWLSMTGKVGSRVAASSLHRWASISTLGSTGGGSVCILRCQSMSSLLHLGKCTTSESLGVEHFQPSLVHSGEFYVSYSCMISRRTCHRSIQTSYSSGTLLDGHFLASHSSQHVGRHFSLLSYHKKSCHGFWSVLGIQGLPSLHLSVAAHTCMLCR